MIWVTLVGEGECAAALRRRALTGVQELRDDNGQPVPIALLSDRKMSDNPREQKSLRGEYLTNLESAGLAQFFQPPSSRVTLSTDLGVFKPNAALFQAALHKISPDLHASDVVFVTENGDDVEAARSLHFQAIHFGVDAPTKRDVLQSLQRFALAEGPATL